MAQKAQKAQKWAGLVRWTSLLGKWLIIKGASKKSVKNGPEMDQKWFQKAVDGTEGRWQKKANFS